MARTTPQLDAALAGDAPTIFGAIEIVFPAYTLRLLDGAGVVSFGGKTFSGIDAKFGTLGSIDDLSEGMGDEAPGIAITLLPASDVVAADLAAANMQGSQVSIWLGAIDRASGLPIPDPMLLFLGEIDVPTLEGGGRERSVTYECVSVLERFMEEEEGVKLSSAFHEDIWPGEKGFENVTGVTQDIYWGASGPGSKVSVGGYSPGSSVSRGMQQVLR